MQPETTVVKGSIVKLTWEDSATIHGWREVHYGEIGEIRSAGIVLESNKEQLTITTSVNDEETPICPISIPWSCIREVETIG